MFSPDDEVSRIVYLAISTSWDEVSSILGIGTTDIVNFDKCRS